MSDALGGKTGGSMADRDSLRELMSGYGSSPEAPVPGEVAVTVAPDGIPAAAPASSTEKSDHIAADVGPNRDDLRKVFARPECRAALLRGSLDDDFLIGASKVNVEDVVTSFVHGVMDERAVGPHSPYVTYHTVIDIAQQVLHEALVVVAQLPPNNNGVAQ